MTQTHLVSDGEIKNKLDFPCGYHLFVVYYSMIEINQSCKSYISMKNLETLKAELVALADGSSNTYWKKSKALKSKIKNYNNATNIMKRDGVKTIKFENGYKVTYKGIVAHIYEDACVDSYWTINILEGDFELYWCKHDSKSAAVWFFYNNLK